MENVPFKTLKKLLCSGLFCAGIHYDIDSSVIRKHDLEYHLRQTADQFLTVQGLEPCNIPSRLQEDYEQKLQTAKQELLTLLVRQGRSYLEPAELETTLNRIMRPFADNLRSVIHDYQLEEALQHAIQSYLAIKGLHQDNIPARDVAEYVNRCAHVMTTLQTIMRNDKRNYVRVFEVDREIDNELKVFVRRILQAQTYQPKNSAKAQAGSTGFDWFNQFFSHPVNTYTASTAPGTTTNASKIMHCDLEQSVTNAAYGILRSHNVDPNKIPARAVSEYSEKVQKSLRLLKNIIAQSGRNYVWRDELETTMLQEMQSVIDTINFKGESCAICLDTYTTGQRIGIVSCSHHYHSDCIYTWFKQQKTCPLCRAQNVFVAQIETMK